MLIDGACICQRVRVLMIQNWLLCLFPFQSILDLDLTTLIDKNVEFGRCRQLLRKVVWIQTFCINNFIIQQNVRFTCHGIWDLNSMSPIGTSCIFWLFASLVVSKDAHEKNSQTLSNCSIAVCQQLSKWLSHLSACCLCLSVVAICASTGQPIWSWNIKCWHWIWSCTSQQIYHNNYKPVQLLNSLSTFYNVEQKKWS